MADLITPEVVAALEKAGPKVLGALGMDVAAGASDVAAVGEFGANPLADGAAVVTTPIAAAKDAEAIASTQEILQAMAKSPAMKAALERGGKTIAEISEEVAKRGPVALKEALETPEGRGIATALKETWSKLPDGAKVAIAGAAAYLGPKIGDAVSGIVNDYVKPAVENLIGKPVEPEARPTHVTISQNDGPQRDIAKGGLSGRVVGDDGKNVEFKVGRDTYTIHNLPDDRLKELLSHGNDYQHLAITPEGRVMISDLGKGAPQMPQQSHGGR